MDELTELKLKVSRLETVNARQAATIVNLRGKLKFKGEQMQRMMVEQRLSRERAWSTAISWQKINKQNFDARMKAEERVKELEAELKK